MSNLTKEQLVERFKGDLTAWAQFIGMSIMPWQAELMEALLASNYQRPRYMRDRGKRIFIGVDVAKPNSDSTVYHHVTGYTVTHILVDDPHGPALPPPAHD